MNRKVFALLGAALCGACAAPTEPRFPAGRFALQLYGEHPLPAILQESTLARLTIVADTMLVAPDGTGVRRITRRAEFLDGSRSPETSRYEVSFDMQRTRDGLVVTEQRFCADSHQSESCREHPAAVSGDILVVGMRRYSRVAVAL